MLVAATPRITRDIDVSHVYLDGWPIPIISRYEHEPRPWPESEQRTLGGQLLQTATRVIHRISFEAENLTQQEWAFLLDVFQRTNAGGRVMMRLEEWPRPLAWTEAISATRQAISVPNPGPEVWPVFVIEAVVETEAPGLVWRGGNLVRNGRAERGATDTSLDGWTRAGTARRVRTIVPPGEGRRFAFYTTNTATFTQGFDVVPGQFLKVAALAYANVSGNYTGLLQLTFKNAAGVTVGSPAATTAQLSQGWLEVSHAVQVPATAVTAELLLDSSSANPVYWSDVRCHVVDDPDDELPPYREGFERKVELDETLDPGDVVEIFPHAGVALLNGEPAAPTADSGFFSLAPGANLVVATTESSTVDYRVHVRLDWTLPVRLQMRSEITPFGRDGAWEPFGRTVRFEAISA